MKLVQVKGSNGSGKTTVVKQLLKLDECTFLRYDNGKIYATLDFEGGWVAVGAYYAHKPMGGCDMLSTIDDIKEAIEATVNYCLCSDMDMEGVIFEGMMISTIKSTFYAFLQLMEAEYGVEPLMVILNTTGSGCVERIYKRRYQQRARRRRLNVDNVISKCELVIRHAKTYDPKYVRWMNVESIPLDRMATVFLEAVKDVPNEHDS